MQNAPIISVIMPSYNVAPTVVRAINSLLAQTYEDFELLIVNDASTDETAAVVQNRLAALKDNRLRLITLPTNIGLSGARNAGLDAATGEFVTFLDADDEYLPEFLRTVVDAMDVGVDIAIAGHLVVRPDGSETPRHSHFVGECSGEQAVRHAMADRLTPFTWDKLYRRALFEGVRYPVGSTRFEDMTVNIILYPRARTIRSVKRPVHRYYISAQSLTWGRIPTRADTDLALRDLDELLPHRFRSGTNARFYASMRLLITLITAQSAIMKVKNQPAAQATIDDCRRALTFSQIAQTTLTRPPFAAAALLLKIFPKPFAALYIRHSAASYGLAQ
ncbi:glycosyltransferase family 2 protein [Pseudarthrobacter siccitolerans]